MTAAEKETLSRLYKKLTALEDGQENLNQGQQYNREILDGLSMKVDSLARGMHGDRENDQPGLITRQRDDESRLNRLESEINSINNKIKAIMFKLSVIVAAAGLIGGGLTQIAIEMLF